jgi:hypothetical protein
MESDLDVLEHRHVAEEPDVLERPGDPRRVIRPVRWPAIGVPSKRIAPDVGV